MRLLNLGKSLVINLVINLVNPAKFLGLSGGLPGQNPRFPTRLGLNERYWKTSTFVMTACRCTPGSLWNPINPARNLVSNLVKYLLINLVKYLVMNW